MDTLLVFVAVLLGSIGSSLSEGQLRLVGGDTSYEGRVEIYLTDQWGTVCDDNWGSNDAKVVCRQLGFYAAISAPRGARFGPGSGPILLDNVACSGSESSLASCLHNGVGNHNCDHSEDAGVVCESTPSWYCYFSNGDCSITQVDGDNGDWTIETTGNGYEHYYASFNSDSSQHSEVNFTLPTFYSSVARLTFWYRANNGHLEVTGCSDDQPTTNSNKYSLFDTNGVWKKFDEKVICTSTLQISMVAVQDSGGTPDVRVDAIEVSPAVRLVGGSVPYEGRVEIYLSGQWGTVCDDGWGLQDARVVCRQLGYPRATAAHTDAYFGQGSGDILLDNVACEGTESSLAYCPHPGVFVEYCNHDEDAGVICELPPSWSCYFGNGDCSISQVDGDNGNWTIVTSDEGNEYYASFDPETDRQSEVNFSLPTIYSSVGRLSFWYLANNAHLKVTGCSNDQPTSSLPDTNGDWMKWDVNIICASTLEIYMTAVQDSDDTPDVRVDAIRVSTGVWSCDFSDNDCSITQASDDDDGKWQNRGNDRYFHARDLSHENEQAISYLPVFPPGTRKFTFRYYSDNNGHLEIASTCSNHTTSRILNDTSGSWENFEMNITCSSKIEISFTAVRKSGSPDVRIDDIRITELMLPAPTTVFPTTAPPTLETVTRRTSMTTSSTTPKAGARNQQTGGQNTTAIVAAVVIIIVVVVLVIVALLVCRHRRRKSAEKEATELQQPSPSSKDNTYTNSAYSSALPDYQQPEVVQVPGSYPNMNDVMKPPGGDEEYSYAYTETEGNQVRYNTGASASDSAMNDHSYQSVKPKEGAIKGNTNRHTDQKDRDINYELDGGDYNVLMETPSRSQYQEQRPVKPPASSGDDTYHHLDHDGSSPMAQHDDGYGEVSATSQGEHGEETYNVLDHGGVALDINNERKPQARFRKGVNNEVDTTYNTLGLVDDGNQQSPPTPDIGAYGALDQNPATAHGESDDAYNVLHQSSKTTSDKARRQASRDARDVSVDNYNVLHSGREVGDYHQYQDFAAEDHPDQSYQHGALDDEDYNVLHSGKEVSDYHLYQATEPPKDSDDVYYSAIKEQNPKGNGSIQHEPIYSDEVYSDFN